jgi:hypothetical protein
MAAALIAAARFMADPKNADKVATSAEVTGRTHEAALAAVKSYLQYGLWPLDNDGMPQPALEAYIGAQVKSGAIKEGTAPSYQRLVDPSIWRDAKALVDKQ